MGQDNQPAKSFNVALVQMLVEGGEKERNLARAEERIARAAEMGSEIVLLPETLDLGWTHPSALQQAEPIPEGGPCQRLAAAARRHRVVICAGLTERCGAQVFNSAVLLDRDGKLLLLHRKLNELEIGHMYYAQGDRLGVAETEFGRIGVMICADGKAQGQVLTRALCHMGADLILSPSAWAKPANYDHVANPYGQVWRDAYMPVARQFQAWILSASNVGPMTAGPWAGYNCIGCSLVVDPLGRAVLQGDYGVDADTLLIAQVQTVRRPARGELWDAHLASYRAENE